ncbi:MAG TPA: oxygen-dependent coproporphyrinogen oxidase [Bacteroidetes bacterium]|nr:oxygen-dependent coproporphyrinogen oxidase [Bacteroidota bacterium]
MKNRFIDFIHSLQDQICLELENQDGESRFLEDSWKREGGGGGRTRVISNGRVFEKGGVNTSVVHGVLPELIRERFNVEQGWFLAAGISLVLHPKSPLIPTVHANYRYFELYDKEGGEKRDSWFGGGADLTPYYLDDDDARHFHIQHKHACDAIHPSLYPIFKKDCDNYFHNSHRGESRGIGGIFYDYMRPDDGIAEKKSASSTKEGNQSTKMGEISSSNQETNEGPSHKSHKSEGKNPLSNSKDSPEFGNSAKMMDVKPQLSGEQLLQLAKNNGQAFIDAYIPIVQKNKQAIWIDEQRYWQEIRRGRYVEFNLIHDRGTLFGLRTDGRVESILMSLPPRVRWDYDFQIADGSPESALISVLKQPKSWIT